MFWAFLIFKKISSIHSFFSSIFFFYFSLPLVGRLVELGMVD